MNFYNYFRCIFSKITNMIKLIKNDPNDVTKDDLIELQQKIMYKNKEI